MDGLSTYQLSYQDATGHVYTSRITTDNPAARQEQFNEPFMDKMLGSVGYELLSVTKVEEIHLDAIPARRASDARLSARMYKAMLVVGVLLVGLDVSLSVQEHFTAVDLQEQIAHISELQTIGITNQKYGKTQREALDRRLLRIEDWMHGS